MVRNTKLALKILGRHANRSKVKETISIPLGECPSNDVAPESPLKKHAKPIVEGILPIDQLLKMAPQTPSVEERLDIHLPVITSRTHETSDSAGDGCPFMDLNDSRCSQHFTLSHMDEAFATCLSGHESCPIFEDLLQKYARPISFASARKTACAKIEVTETAARRLSDTGRSIVPRRESVGIGNASSTTDRLAVRQKA